MRLHSRRQVFANGVMASSRGRGVAVCGRAIFVMSECWCPHPRLPDRRGVYLEDAADNEPSAITSKSSSFHSQMGAKLKRV